MPEYHLPGSDSAEFKKLPEFVQGYLEAAFFTLPDADPDLSEMGFSDLDPDSLAKIIKDCEAFLAEHQVSVDILTASEDVDYDIAAAGRDFFYTRSGHGVGYWDRGFESAEGVIADHLSEVCRKWGDGSLVEWDFQAEPEAEPEDDTENDI